MSPSEQWKNFQGYWALPADACASKSGFADCAACGNGMLAAIEKDPLHVLTTPALIDIAGVLWACTAPARRSRALKKHCSHAQLAVCVSRALSRCLGATLPRPSSPDHAHRAVCQVNSPELPRRQAQGCAQHGAQQALVGDHQVRGPRVRQHVWQAWGTRGATAAQQYGSTISGEAVRHKDLLRIYSMPCCSTHTRRCLCARAAAAAGPSQLWP